MIGVPAIYAAQALATGLGAAYAWRVREHRPLAALIALGFGLDLALEFLPAEAFVARMVVGSAYPWAVLGALTVSLSGKGRLGSEGRSAEHHQAHLEQPRIVGGVPLVGVPGGPRGQDDAEPRANFNGHARTLAPLALLFASYLAALLSSGVRGPALAWCYAGAQAGLAVAMGWRVWGWKAKGSTVTTPSSPLMRIPTAHMPTDRAPLLTPWAFRSIQTIERTNTATRRPPTATEISAIICAATEAAQIPAYVGLPSWWSARAVYAFCYVLLIVLHVCALLGGIPSCRISTSST